MRSAAALSAVTAAVVGVILNLALWFGLHVIFAETRVLSGHGLHLTVPVLASVNLAAAALTAHGLAAQVTQIAVSRTRPAGGLHLLAANNPVFLITGNCE